MTRLFVAVWPSEDVLAQLEDLERPRDQGVKWVPTENLHITLRFLGDADADEVGDRFADVTLPRVTARVGPANDVVAERALILPVSVSTNSPPRSFGQLAVSAPNGNARDSRGTSRWRASPARRGRNAASVRDSPPSSRWRRSRWWPAPWRRRVRSTTPSEPGRHAEPAR